MRLQKQLSPRSAAEPISRSKTQSEQNKLFTTGDDLTRQANALIGKIRTSNNQSLTIATEHLNSDLLAVRVANWRTQATHDPKGLATLKDAVGKATESIASLERAEIAPD